MAMSCVVPEDLMAENSASKAVALDVATLGVYMQVNITVPTEESRKLADALVQDLAILLRMIDFEPNDKFLRANLETNLVDWLDDQVVKQKVDQFTVICNDTNNPPTRKKPWPAVNIAYTTMEHYHNCTTITVI